MSPSPSPGALWSRRIRVAVVYHLFALLVLMPSLASGGLIGHPDVDVWNHAWGFWWFWDSIRHGALPLRTALLGAPAGGVLYYIDPVGAFIGLPLTALFGPAVSWNAVMVMRVAMAGWATHGLCRALSGPGPQPWVAGIAMASAPYLLVEVANGISEVTDVGWVPLSLWAAAQLQRRGGRRTAVLLGLSVGMSTLACFYYGLLAALLVGGLLIVPLLRRRLPLPDIALAALLALVVGLPGLLLLRWSLLQPDALVTRSAELNQVLLEHNAVDPRDLLLPFGSFRVDFAARYGEAFQHTLYLRWTVLLLAAAAIWRFRRPTLPWALLGLGSAVLGLGVLLYWGGDWVRLDGRRLLLPFGWLQKLVPALAVTHPARLGLGAVVMSAVLAGWGLAGKGRWALLAIPLLLGESLLAGAVRWPLPASPTAVPEIYTTIREEADPRAILDLPANVGGTMATSRYFWFQAVHGRAMPWFPDAHAAHNGDIESMRLFERTPAGGPPPALRPASVERLRRNYGWILIHTEFSDRVGTTAELSSTLEAALGPPTHQEGAGPTELRIWRLPTASRTAPGREDRR
jgi:hypothetical protein